MILQPSWKLLNKHLPIFTEVQGYGKNLSDLTFLTEKEITQTAEDVESDMRG